MYHVANTGVQAGTYFYRLRQVDVDGVYTYSGVLEVKVAPPAVFRLYSNFPNLFNPSTVISYSIPEHVVVRLDICDVQGTHVLGLVRAVQDAGRYRVMWNGRDHAGREVSSGVYLVSLKAGSFTSAMKIIKIQ